jgi:hypothetical protein
MSGMMQHHQRGKCIGLEVKGWVTLTVFDINDRCIQDSLLRAITRYGLILAAYRLIVVLPAAGFVVKTKFIGLTRYGF